MPFGPCLFHPARITSPGPISSALPWVAFLLLLSSCISTCDSQDAEDDFASAAPQEVQRMADDDYCKPNSSYVWCLPRDYNQEKHPFTYANLINKTLPWTYDFTYFVEEITNINDKAQTISMSMYFGVSWLDPRLRINDSATEWTEVKTGPKDEVNVSPESLKYIWYPELEIYGLEKFGRQRVLKEMSGVRIRRNKTIHYELGVRITISCRMSFDQYPLDAHTCQFQVGSYYDTKKTVQCNSHTTYNRDRQRSLQHYIEFEPLREEHKTVELPSGSYAACGFQIQLVRKQMQYIFQVYLPSCMFVAVSWVSFLIKPEIVPGRMALLVTLFLVLINIFMCVREMSPLSSRLNAIDLYLVVCIFLVFSALMEYAVILLLLNRKRRPKYDINSAIKKMLFNGDLDSIGVTGRPKSGIAGNAESGGSVTVGGGASGRGLPRHPSTRQPTPASLEEHKKLRESGDDIEVHVPASRTRRRREDDANKLLVQMGESVEVKNQKTRQAHDAPIHPHTQAICDNIDYWALWIAPPIFIIFNIAYWLSYKQEPQQFTAYSLAEAVEDF